MTLYNKTTGKSYPVEWDSRDEVVKKLYSSCELAFLNISWSMEDAIRKFANAEIKPYVPTRRELSVGKRDSSYLDFIPKYYVPGYDEYVSSKKFENKLKDEFFERLFWEDERVIRLVKKYTCYDVYL